MHISLGESSSEPEMGETAFRIGATLPICHPQDQKHSCLLNGAGGGWQQAAMGHSLSLPLLLPRKLRCWDSVSQYGCTWVINTYTKQKPRGLWESGFPKEQVNRSPGTERASVSGS